jgi:hypothetical protein
MSIESITGDDFAGLSEAEHEEALDLYDQAISNEIEQGHTLEVDYDQFAASRDKLLRLLTLRKVHLVRLAELRGELTDKAAA